jgi:arylsulfatase A-like enzyme
MVADDLGREVMDCYGCNTVQTPNLDTLTASGSASILRSHQRRRVVAVAPHSTLFYTRTTREHTA